MFIIKNDKKTSRDFLVSVVGGQWKDSFTTDVEIGKSYKHHKYGNITVRRIYIKPRITVNRWFFMWKKISTDYEVSVVFSHKPPGSSGALSGMPLDQFVSGIDVHSRFRSELGTQLATLSKEKT